MKCCETCGHPLPELGIVHGLTKKQNEILIALHNAGQNGLSIEAIADKIYSDCADGGPLSAHSVIRSQLSLMNKKLKQKGLYIKTEHNQARRLQKYTG